MLLAIAISGTRMWQGALRPASISNISKSTVASIWRLGYVYSLYHGQQSATSLGQLVYLGSNCDIPSGDIYSNMIIRKTLCHLVEPSYAPRFRVPLDAI